MYPSSIKLLQFSTFVQKKEMSVAASTAAAAASAPSMDHQRQQRDYAYENQTQGGIQYRQGEPQDFGAVPFARDRRDEDMRVRGEITGALKSTPGIPSAQELLGLPPSGGAGVPSVIRTMPITQKEIDYAQDWKAQYQQYYRDQWLFTKFDLTDPAIRAYFIKLFPDYERRMLSFVKSKFALMQKWTEVAMFGIRSQEDADFLYNVETGIIILPRGYQNFQALTDGWDPTTDGTRVEHFTQGAATEFVTGPFNLFRYITGGEAQTISGYDQRNQYFNAASAEGAYNEQPASGWYNTLANVPRAGISYAPYPMAQGRLLGRW